MPTDLEPRGNYEQRKAEDDFDKPPKGFFRMKARIIIFVVLLACVIVFGILLASGKF